MQTIIILYVVGFIIWAIISAADYVFDRKHPMLVYSRDLKCKARRFFLAPVWPIAAVWFGGRLLFQMGKSAFGKDDLKEAK